MTNPHITRIPNEKSSEYHSWELPQIDDSTNVLSSAEKEDRERRDLERLRGNEVVGETVSEDRYTKPLTAKQISELAESTRQQGYQDGLKEGKETGYKEGFDSGEKKALDAAKEQIEKEGDRLISLVNGLIDPFEQHTSNLENIIFNTIKSLAQSVVKRELKTDSSQIRDLVKKSISALPSGSDNITIYLNPDDISLMDDFFLERAVQWKLNGDPSMIPGGCKVQTKESFVDFSVEKRLEQTLEKFIAGDFLGNPDNEILDSDTHNVVESSIVEPADTADFSEEKKPTNEDEVETDIPDIESIEPISTEATSSETKNLEAAHDEEENSIKNNADISELGSGEVNTPETGDNG
ncbi:MAG: flagellar assembly protein FliH [Cellvibrionaceae bacterium]